MKHGENREAFVSQWFEHVLSLFGGGDQFEYHPPLTIKRTAAPFAFAFGVNGSKVAANPNLWP